METKEKFKFSIEKLAGKKVWDFRLGESTGSIISFECGEEIECENGGNEERKSEGKYSFMIYCSWKISNADKIITSWKDDIVLLKEGVLKLENLTISSIFIKESFDMLIEFEKGYRLQVFCDEGINSDFDCNWFFRDSRKYYSINNNGEIEIE